ncbi:MAG: hypothetical protein EA378_05785 [Phycisphaerales bacterium]|nr:MAG: hypothetical protein EA378_05785 [Phycisphaerales bacterium]
MGVVGERSVGGGGVPEKLRPGRASRLRGTEFWHPMGQVGRVLAMRRYEHANSVRFLTFSCLHRLPLFRSRAAKDVFVAQLQRTRERHTFLLHAWVLMPEHVHLVLRANSESDVPTTLRTLKGGVARRLIADWRSRGAGGLERLERADGSMAFWQSGGGYDRNCRDLDEIREKIDYCHINPVRRGLVERPGDWVWSSARFWQGQREGEIACDHLR